MSNISPEAKKRYAATASAINKAKLESGEYRQFLVRGLAADMDIIDAAIAAAGGSRTQALKAICEFYLAHKG